MAAFLAIAARRPDADARLAAVALERRRHFFGHEVEKRPLLRAGRDDVVDRRERAFRKRDAPAVLALHVERLRRGHFMSEMKSDQELRLAAGRRTYGVRVQTF